MLVFSSWAGLSQTPCPVSAPSNQYLGLAVPSNPGTISFKPLESVVGEPKGQPEVEPVVEGQHLLSNISQVLNV